MRLPSPTPHRSVLFYFSSHPLVILFPSSFRRLKEGGNVRGVGGEGEVWRKGGLGGG